MAGVGSTRSARGSHWYDLRRLWQLCWWKEPWPLGRSRRNTHLHQERCGQPCRACPGAKLCHPSLVLTDARSCRSSQSPLVLNVRRCWYSHAKVQTICQGKRCSRSRGSVPGTQLPSSSERIPDFEKANPQLRESVEPLSCATTSGRGLWSKRSCVGVH